MKREQFTWYRSYYEALKTLPAKDFKKAVLAVCAYALDEETPNLDGVPNSVFTLIRPTLDSGRIKAANRMNKARTKQEQNGNKPEQTAKEKENEKESESESENDSSLTPTPLSALCASCSGVVLESSVPEVSEANAGGAPPPTPPAEKRGAKKAPDVFAEFAGENAELLEALRDFEKMRKGVKKPLTDRAKKMLTNNLRNNFPSELWIPVLDQSIKKCWLDVYPLKEPQLERKPSRSGNVFLDLLREEEAKNGTN